jgi:hypothetical protein
VSIRIPHELLDAYRQAGESLQVGYQSLIKDAMVAYLQLIDQPVPSQETSESTVSYVYFVQEATGYRRIKIGWTKDVRSRVKALEQQFGTLRLLLVVPGSLTVERSYHVMFDAYRHEGEWFMPHTVLLSYIENQRAKPRETEKALLPVDLQAEQLDAPLVPTTPNNVSEEELAAIMSKL